jgi:WD40 repeat protein
MVWGNGITNFDRNLAIVIGIDVYKSKDIHHLSTAVSDAEAVAKLLEEKYPYNATDKNPQIIRLCNENATLDGIRNLLHNRLPNELKPTDQDRLIVYFAGHGLPKNSDEGPSGYLVPHDAEIGRDKSFLPMQEVYDVLVELNCHHLLVVLDCCFAGTFRWATSRKLIARLETVHKEHYDRFIRYPAWQVITSAAYDQEALDFVKLSADRRGQVDNQPHSPFAVALLEALQDGLPDAQGKQHQNADFTKDGVVTAHELIVYLNDRVSELSKDRQVPGLYPLKQEYDKGEFVFVKPDFDPAQLQAAPTLNDDNNPYRGLKSFGERHASFFFGRQKLVEELSDRLNKPLSPLTVVLGTSGSGKSSLVKAGLIPYLRQESLQPEATQLWYILNPLRPGKSPFTELARSVLPLVQSNLIPALAQVGFLDQKFQEILDTNAKQKSKPNQEPSNNITTDLVKLAQRWQTASPEAKLLIIVDYFTQLQTIEPAEQAHLSNLYDEINKSIDSLIQFFQQDFNLLANAIVEWSLSQPNTKLLLVIDQFEELLTMTESDRGSLEQDHLSQADELQEWRKFLSLLQVVLGKNQQQLRVVVTLRSDFEPRFLSSALKDYWQAARFPIRAMSSDELREAIEGPALKQALYFNPPELVSKLIDEVGQMPGALPLLSFTLSELYSNLYQRWTKEQNTDRALQEKDYQALGGVAGALTRRATEEYETLDKAYQATMRRLMLRMVVIDGGGVARRRVPDAELIYSDIAETDRMVQVRERLVATRLLVKGQEANQGYVEPAHDFLVRGWDKLQSWIKEEQDNLALQRRLTLAANDWHDSTDNRDDLLWIRDPRLMIFEEGLESAQWLNKKEAEFVKNSISQRDNELDEAQNQLLLSEDRRVIAELREKAIRASYLSTTYPREALEIIIQAVSENLEQLPNIIDVVQLSLHEVTESSLLPNFLWKYTAPSVAISDDGNTIASIHFNSDEGRMVGSIWNKQGILVNLLEEYEGDARQSHVVAISANGEIIITGEKNSIVLRNRQGKKISQIHGHTDSIQSLAISLDGKMIVSGSKDNRVLLWCEKRQLIGELHEHTNGINAIAVSADGNIIVTGSSDNKVRLYANKLLSQVFERSAISLSISADGETITSSSLGDDDSWLWNKEGTFEKRIRGRNAKISANGELIVTSENNIMATNSTEKNVLLFWNKQGDLLRQIRFGKLQRHEDTAYSTDISADGKIIIVNGMSTIGIWNRENTALSIFRGHKDCVTSVSIVNDERTIITGSKDRSICLWNFQGEIIDSKIYRNAIVSIASSLDGKTIISSEQGMICSWDRQINSCQKFPVKHLVKQRDGMDNISDSVVSVSADGATIVSCHGYPAQISEAGVPENYQYLRLWNKQGELLKELKPQQGSLTAASISSDGNIVASGGERGGISIWDWKSSDGSLTQMKLHKGEISSLAISNDAEIIVSGSRDNTVIIWNRQGELIAQCQGHEQAITSVAISDNGNVVVSGSEDGTVRVWNKQGKTLAIFRGHVGAVLSVAISPNGKMIVSGGEDMTLRLWQADWNEWFKICCNKLAYYLISQNPKTDIITNEYCNDCLTYSWNSQDLLMIFMRKGQSEEEAKKSTASALVRKGERLSKTGKIESAIAAYEEAQQIYPEVMISASDWGTLSWFGCLHGHSSHSQILAACEKAVTSEPESGHWYDVRGLAMALQGEKYFPEAIKDFQVFITWTTDSKKRSQRKSWINYLKQNRNPFTQKELLRLIRQEKISSIPGDNSSKKPRLSP